MLSSANSLLFQNSANLIAKYQIVFTGKDN
jgi:hypothetical protein